MITYIKEDKILLSNEMFGQHLSSSFRSDEKMCMLADECDILMDEAAKHYANIFMQFGDLIDKKIEEIKRLAAELKMIAPHHGMIWKNRIISSVLALTGLKESQSRRC